MIIGITGKSGVGKTTYSKTFKGYYIINVDEIGHKVMEKADIKEKIKKTFNIDLNKVSRVALGDIVFNNRQKKKELNDIIWEDMKKEIDTIIKNNKNVVIEWILLPHSHYFSLCDKKILIKTEEQKRVQRVLKRDNISYEYLKARDNNSIEYNEKDFDEIIIT